MTFDKTKVYTALNADEVKVGSIGYVADSIYELREAVEAGPDSVAMSKITMINNDSCSNRFIIQNSSQLAYNLFYLVEGPKEKMPRPYIDTAEMLRDFADRFDLLSHDDRLPAMWLKHSHTCYLVVCVLNTSVSIIAPDVGVHTLLMEELFNDYTYLDGSVIGVKEEE